MTIVQTTTWHNMIKKNMQVKNQQGRNIHPHTALSLNHAQEICCSCWGVMIMVDGIEGVEGSKVCVIRM